MRAKVSSLPPGNGGSPHPHRRRRLNYVELSRVLGAAVSTNLVSASSHKGRRWPIVNAPQSSRGALNDLQYLAATDGWFEIEPPPDKA